MESLYDSLHLQNPKTPEAQPEPWPQGNLTGKAFADAVVNSREFRQYILTGITLGDLPPVIMCRLIDLAWGKPVERLEVKDKTKRNYDDYTEDQIEERMRFLSNVLVRLRASKDSDTTSIH